MYGKQDIVVKIGHWCHFFVFFASLGRMFTYKKYDTKVFFENLSFKYKLLYQYFEGLLFFSRYTTFGSDLAA